MLLWVFIKTLIGSNSMKEIFYVDRKNRLMSLFDLSSEKSGFTKIMMILFVLNVAMKNLSPIDPSIWSTSLGVIMSISCYLAFTKKNSIAAMSVFGVYFIHQIIQSVVDPLLSNSWKIGLLSFLVLSILFAYLMNKRKKIAGSIDQTKFTFTSSGNDAYKLDLSDVISFEIGDSIGAYIYFNNGGQKDGVATFFTDNQVFEIVRLAKGKSIEINIDNVSNTEK